MQWLSDCHRLRKNGKLASQIFTTSFMVVHVVVMGSEEETQILSSVLNRNLREKGTMVTMCMSVKQKKGSVGAEESKYVWCEDKNTTGNTPWFARA